VRRMQKFEKFEDDDLFNGNFKKKNSLFIKRNHYLIVSKNMKDLTFPKKSNMYAHKAQIGLLI
jgi:hypothetical protein